MRVMLCFEQPVDPDRAPATFEIQDSGGVSFDPDGVVRDVKTDTIYATRTGKDWYVLGADAIYHQLFVQPQETEINDMLRKATDLLEDYLEPSIVNPLQSEVRHLVQEINDKTRSSK